MNKYLISIIALIILSFSSYSQVKDYDETALLFSQERLNGSARFMAMSGAFGALGGNLSAAEINPAGMAIFKYNAASISLDVQALENSNNFYNLNSDSKNTNLNFAQAGGLIIFNTNSKNWSKFTLSVNTSIANDYNQLINLKGNSGITNESYFLEPDPTADLYNQVENQKMYNNAYGDNAKTTFTLATKYNDKTYFGFSVIGNSIDYNQEVVAVEGSKDINDNTFNGRLNQNLRVIGQGIGFNFGVISIPVKGVRLGVSYQTPIWYNLTEEFNENMSVHLSNTSVTQPDNVDSVYEYQLRSPGKLTGSFAYVFGKEGLISLDYNYKDYSKAKLSPTADFETDFNYNQQINKAYKAVSTLNIGGEYRLKYFSLRAGYHFETSPYVKDDNLDSTQGYSLGFGFKTGNFSKLDFAFNQTNYLDKNRYLVAPKNIISNNLVNKFTVSYSIDF